MNVQTLERGVVDVYGYIKQYTEAKYGGDVSLLTVEDDLYGPINPRRKQDIAKLTAKLNAATTEKEKNQLVAQLAALAVKVASDASQPRETREFLLVLASHVTDQFDINRGNVQDLESRKRLAKVAVLGTIIASVLIPVSLIIAYVFFMRIILRRTPRGWAGVDIARHVLGFCAGAVMIPSFFKLVFMKFAMDKRVLSHLRLVDLQTQVQYTQLLWDPSLRLIHYNTVPEGADARISKDPDLSTHCLGDEEEKVTSGNVKLDIKSVGAGVCARKMPNFKPDYLNQLLGWIKDFYTNEPHILYSLRSLDPDGVAQSITTANTTLNKLVYTSNRRVDQPTFGASANKVITDDILPLLLADYLEIKGVKVMPGITNPIQTKNGYGFLDSQNCIDDCVVKNSDRCSTVTVKDGTCQSFGRFDSAPVLQSTTSSEPSASVFVNKPASVYVLSPTDNHVTSTLTPNNGFETIQGCLKACSSSADCGACHVASPNSRALMVKTDGAPGSIKPSTCTTNCLFVKTPATSLVADAGDITSRLQARKDHLAAKLSDIYQLRGVIPRDVYGPVMARIETALGNEFVTVKAAYESILKKAEALYADQTTARFYVTDSVLANKLGKMSKATFITNLLRPIYDMQTSAAVLNRQLNETSTVAMEKWKFVHGTVVIVMVNLSVLSALAVAYVIHQHVVGAHDDLRDRDYAFVLKVGVVGSGVIFFMTLLSSWLHKTDVRKKAAQKSINTVGAKLSGNIDTITTYLKSEKPKKWVGELLGIGDNWTYNHYTFELKTSSGKVVDVTDPRLRTEKLNAQALNENRPIVGDLRTMLIALDGTINDCQDFLSLRPGVSFPTNEVMLLLVGMGVAGLGIMVATKYLKPGFMLDRLRRLIRMRADEDFDALFEMNDASDYAAHVLLLGGMSVTLLLMSYLSSQSAKNYVVTGEDTCRRSRPPA